MLNINNKRWEDVCNSDILSLLASTEDENFFFEFKADDVSNSKLIEEISAFSNTYGGYIFIGINTDKSIGGCQQWTEQRIHTTIHDSMTPVPYFDVRCFLINGATVLVLKIEKGAMPPYITNKGQIYERISSGSFKITDSNKLNQLYNKRKDQLEKLRNKIELPAIRLDSMCPANLCAYLDMGFEVISSERTALSKDFYHFDLKPLAEYLRSENPDFSVSRVGYSILISFGHYNATDNMGRTLMMNSGLHNYIEIMPDGSIRCRVLLSQRSDEDTTSISSISYLIHRVFKNAYRMLMGDEFADHFIYARKYEKLTVVRQFVPDYKFRDDADEDATFRYSQYLLEHRNKYGNNLIIESNRIPKNDYEIIDKRLFAEMGAKYSADALFIELFITEHANLGFIDLLE